MQPDPRSIEAVAELHGAIRESISVHRASVGERVRRGDAMMGTKFFAMSLAEVDSHFTNELDESDASAVIAIVAASEAAIRDDYRERVAGGFKDVLSKPYAAFDAALSPDAKKRPPFNEAGIVDKIKGCGLFTAHKVNNFRRALRLRNWYAHGRYWLFKQESSSIAPADVYQFSRDLLDEMPS